MRAALYARVSTLDQHSENQLDELRNYAAARGTAEVPSLGAQGVSPAR